MTNIGLKFKMCFALCVSRKGESSKSFCSLSPIKLLICNVYHKLQVVFDFFVLLSFITIHEL
jgi:hypothetical protein